MQSTFPTAIKHVLSVNSCKPLCMHKVDAKCRGKYSPRPLLNPGKLLRDPIRLERPLLHKTFHRFRPLRMRTHRTMATTVISVAPRACMSGSTLRAYTDLSGGRQDCLICFLFTALRTHACTAFRPPESLMCRAFDGSICVHQAIPVPWRSQQKHFYLDQNVLVRSRRQNI